MDRATRDHFYTWLERHVAYGEQDEVERTIWALAQDWPWMPEAMSWPEMRERAALLQLAGWVP